MLNSSIFAGNADLESVVAEVRTIRAPETSDLVALAELLIPAGEVAGVVATIREIMAALGPAALPILSPR